MTSIWNKENNSNYREFNVIEGCYNALVDELSRRIFLARMAFDLGEWDGYIDLIRCSGLMTEDEIAANFEWVKMLAQTQKPVYIYGAGQFGGHTCRMLQKKHINVAGFFDRNYNNIVTRCGLPVLAPPSDDFNKELNIFISLSLPVNEIVASLCKRGVPEFCILNRSVYQMDVIHQYFDFPEHYSDNGIFVDAGCFDCDTSIRFATWCQGKYKKILALEPDYKNLERAKINATQHNIKNIKFLQAGLWNKTQTGCFGALGNDSSRIIENGGENIQLVALDDIASEEHIAFLKMDIEGAEIKALEGAANILKRDRPFCAISAYHKPGDHIALMKYLKQLVPEYRFALRHYSTMAIETVLYAFIENT